VNRIFRWFVRSLFAPVTGYRGAIASTIGFFLGFLPLYSARIPFMIAFSLLFRLNIVALFLGTLIPIFIPYIRQLPFLNLRVLEESLINITSHYSVFASLKHKMELFQSTASGLLGGFIGLASYFFFHWFYNLGLKKKEQNQERVFLDPAKRRWSIIKRISAGFTVFIVLVSVIFIDSLHTDPNFPGLKLKESKTAGGIEPINQSLNEEQLKSQIQETSPSPVIPLKKNHLKSKQEVFGFYVNWDPNSQTSFRKNIGSITTLIPEWLQLTPNLSLKTSTDSTITKLAKAHHIKILPLVNNFIDNKWDTDALHRLLTTPGAEERFIKDLLVYVKKNNFDGINFDFEEMDANDHDHLTQFIQKVSEEFHQKGLIVTMDVPPNNNSFDYPSLAAEVDRMLVMLYDQHNSKSQPGPIAQSDWIKMCLSNLHIPSEKLIVSLGSYGYDWEENSSQSATAMTFGDIMNLGKETNLPIFWNKDAGNPYLRYKIDGKNHLVWFLDAATFYNQMKLAIHNGAKGIAVWRLGSEDPSIWNYINKPKDMQNPSTAIKTLGNPESVHYTGSGEILKVASQSKNGERTIQLDPQGLIQKETYLSLPKPFEIVRYGKPKKKEIVLTFDDGPDPKYTPQILDILDKNHIKGAFFIVGENAELHPELIDRMFKEGHEIGSHTFTHPNIASTTPFQTKMELNANQRLFEEITGHSMNLFRPPYEADAEPSTRSELLPIIRAQDMGYTMVGELIDPNDWKKPSSNEIVKRVLKQLPNGNVILLHDAGGDRSNTVKALPQIIKELKKRGYTFTTVAHLIGKTNSQIMPPVHSDNPYLVYDKAVFKVIQGIRNGLTALFYSAILLGILRLIVFIFLSRRQVKMDKETKIDPDFTPFVSVVIAAYNEEKVIGKTIDSILSSDYPYFEVLIVDDGSKDETAAVVQESYKNHPIVRLIKKPNGGKSSAVNLGFKEANGEIVVALDADTLIAENAISLLVNHFKNEKVAAVSGNVKVGNKGNLLTNWQHIEYVTGFNLERRAFAALNCITVVPGAIGAWRKTSVEEAGFFKEDTLAEDTDITLTLLRQGKKIEFEEKAYAYTEVPEDIKSLAKQRYRWVYGTLQCLWKHRAALFNKKYHSLGFIGLPNMWLFQYIYQTISPIADLLFIIALFGEHPGKAAIGFILFYLLDFATSLYAFRLEKEDPKPLASLFLQRILYKQLMTYVVIKSILSAIKGVTVGWNKLKRKGNVTQETHMAGN
jgi:cellulose synthase/poly-beta-1,6-N-acetylglucosamine synthase-like glycosyltransferase/peptidoglycan/xylan/chitin deacetylase (PgdA/CDA1 family)/spore germination protein YaaH